MKVNLEGPVALVTGAARLQCPFVAATGGVVNLTKAMALESGAQGVLVNSIAPGSILTEGTRKRPCRATTICLPKIRSFMGVSPKHYARRALRESSA